MGEIESDDYDIFDDESDDDEEAAFAALFRPPPLDLLFVCRQTYAEAVLLPFAINSFYLLGAMDDNAWLDCMYPAQIAAIRAIQMHCCNFRKPYSLLKRLRSLKSVKVHCMSVKFCISSNGCYEIYGRIRSDLHHLAEECKAAMGLPELTVDFDFN